MDGLIEEVDRSLYELVLLMALRYYGGEVGSEFAEGYQNKEADVAVFRLAPHRITNFDDT